MPVHLRGTSDDYARTVLVPGDPRRARTIAETFFEADFRCVNEERGMLGYTGTFEGKPISVQSVGMGGASAAIYYEELIQLGVKRIVRVGTAGGLDPSLKMGDTVLAVASTPDDPVIQRLLNGEEHAPTATWSLLMAAVRIAEEAGVSLYPGPVVSSALFYDERPGIMERWRDRGHLAVEMEVSTLYTIAALRKVEAVAMATISDLILGTGDTVRISDEELAEGVRTMMQIACRVAVS